MSRLRLDVQLGGPLAGAHHAGGIDGLVGRDHDERADVGTRMARSASRRVASDDVLDGLAGMRLHQRHVLVRGGVEDDVRPAFVEDAAHAGLVEHVGDAESSSALPSSAGATRARERTARSPQRSISTNRLGENCSNWRQISEPMLPALPVTSSTRSSIHWRMSPRSRWTGSRRSRSWIETGRGWTAMRPADQLLVAGQDLDLDRLAAGVFHQLADLRPGQRFARDEHLADAVACSASRHAWSRVPITGTPPIAAPDQRGSSSRKPTTW